MKNLFNHIICLVVLALVSCVNADAVVENKNTGNQPSTSEMGALTLRLDTRSLEGESLNYVLRIYQNNGEEKKLVRKYTSDNELPQYIWLLEGNYTAVVECGSPETTSFDNSYYRGEKDFDIIRGNVAKVEIIAVLQNIPVEVVFDQTIIDGCLEGYHVDVMIADSAEAVTSSTPQLRYTESKVGYFIMPEGSTTLTWRFVGTYEYSSGNKVDIDKSGIIENVELKKHYTLRYKYSKDANGFLGGLSISVDTTLDERDDHIAFNPDPELKGEGFDMTELFNYVGGERKYVATSPSEFNMVNISAGDRVYDLVADSVAGVTVEGLSTMQLSITFSDLFFNSLSGGVQNIGITVGDVDGGVTTKQLPYNLQGVNAYDNIYTNLWCGTSKLSATVFGEHQSVQIAYRNVGASEWTTVNAVASGDNTYAANIDGISAAGNYEYSLVLDGATIGANRLFATESGNQIPNGNMEDWCTASDGALVPYHMSINSFWCTGNHGTAMLSKNITQNSTNVRPGSTGKYSASLDSEYIVVKFAAGNMYVGSWGGMDGTNAVVYFGQPFEYNAKPKAIRFWAKWNCGTIDKVSGGVGKSGDPDLVKIFCCMSTDRHAVDSADANGTTFSPSDANLKSGDPRYDIVLYSAYMETTQSQSEWKLVEIPFVFYGDDPNQIPTHLILTFTCSGYGDYFDGSTNSSMFVDDIELVY